MPSPQQVLDAAVAAGDVPFAVGLVGDAGGTRWQGAAGEAAPGLRAGADTVLRLFSMTKAVGAVAAMILVDRGRLALDAPVDSVLPGFAELRVLDGWDGDVPRLRAPRRRATLRQLASHTSGLAYDIWNAEMLRYRELTGQPTAPSGRLAGLNHPLMFDPGAGWAYGIGPDWLGRVVEAVDGRRIDRFCREEIFAPLGMGSTGFELDADLSGRLAAVVARVPDGGFAAASVTPPAQPEFYGMGHALYGSGADYLRFLRMLLGGGALDGARVLSPAAVAELLANQTGGLRVGAMRSVLPAASADVELFPGTPKGHSLAYLRVEADVPGMRAAGAQGWAGILNTHCWLDPARGIAGLFLTQVRPFCDPRVMAAYAAFERAVYAG